MLPTVRGGRTSPMRSYLRSVCGCMPNASAAMLMKYSSSSISTTCHDSKLIRHARRLLIRIESMH